MRVLMFGWEFPPYNSGGLGVACRGLTRALSKEGIDILFVLPRTTAVSDEHMRFHFAQDPHMALRPFDTILSPYMTQREYREQYGKTEGRQYAYTIFDEVHRYALEAEHIAENETFDVIHAHDWLSFPAGLAAKRISGKPLVLHVHLPAYDQSGGGHVDEEKVAIERAAMLEADCIIAISERVRTLLREKYGIPNQKIRVVYNALDPEDMPPKSKETIAHFFPLTQDAHLAIYLGRLTMHKGPDTFLRAAEVVAAEDPKARFVIAGSGDMERQLIEQAARSSIREKVFFAGFVRGEDKENLIRAADVFVMPSVAEPFGLVALEALAAGTPAIISKQSGVSEVVKHALKVDFWDVEDMANKMIAVFSYAPLSKELAREGEREVRSSTWEIPAKACIAIYTECMNARQRA